MPNQAFDYNYIINQNGSEYTATNSNTGVVQFVNSNGDIGLLLNNVMAALPSTGGFIKIKPGTYTIATAISIPVSNIVIQGCGISTQLNVDASVVATSFTRGSAGLAHIRLERLYLHQTNATQQGTGINLSDCNNSGLDKVKIDDFATGLNYVDASTSVTNSLYGNFTDITVLDCTNPIKVQATATLFSGIKFRALAGGAGTGITCTYCTDVAFLNPSSVATAASSLTGISIDANSVGVSIYNPYVSTYATGLTLTAGANDTTVIGGAITGNTTDITDSTTSGTTFINVSKTSGSANYSSGTSNNPTFSGTVTAAAITASGLITANGGITAGAGEIITQDHGLGTISSNAVTINHAYMEITTVSLSTAAGASMATATVTNSVVASTSKIIFSVEALSATAGVMFAKIGTVSAGSFTFSLVNVGGASANGTYIVKALVV